MISRLHYYGSLLSVVVYSLPLFAFGLTAYLRFGNMWMMGVKNAAPQYYLVLLVFTEIVWVIAANYYKLSSVADLFWEYTGIRAAFLASFVTLLSQTALLVFAKQLVVSRIFILCSNVIVFTGVVIARNFFRFTSESSAWPRQSEKILVVGTDQYSRRSMSLLRRIPFFRCQIQAYLQLPGQPVLVHDAPVIGVTELGRLGALDFDEVVIAITSKDYLQVSSVFESLQNFGKPIRAVLDFGPRLSVQDKVFQVGRLQMMNMASSPIESFAYTVLKRLFDLFFATLGLIFLSPLLVALALLVKVSSRGPVLFRQQRVGRNGQVFTLLKFRTMNCSSTADSDTIWTTKADARCTAIGAILRRFSLDELPQLINVIRGEMSLVGPRPERPYFVEKFRTNIQKYNVRHCCRVGMTGWAQVHGLRGDTSIADRVRYDLYYVRNWSLGLDLQIIFRTMFTALKGENGY